MKARTKITLWTTSFSLVVAISFSCVVLYELLEQPLRLIDRELRDVRYLTIQFITSVDSPLHETRKLTQHPFDRFWVKVKDEQKRTLLTTPMTEHVEIPPRTNDKFYFEKKDIALEHIWISEEDKDELDLISGKLITFRVMHESYQVNNKVYDLLIARPIPVLALEISELIIEILCGVLLCAILVVVLSYYLSGKILQPLVDINNLIKEISDVSLYKRIPVGKNQDELHTLSSALNNMFDRLHSSFNRQKEFIGNASHELKSPLTILMLGHEKLLSEPLPETVRCGLEKQLDTLRRLSKMVRNLLEISRLEQHESFKKERINLVQLVQHVIEEFEDIIQDKNITLHSDLKRAHIIGDPEKILRMIINLLDNAIKYNLFGTGEIWISTKDTGNRVDFAISNTGSAIPKESLKKVFEQFYRVEKSRSTVFGGAGLGLTIVQQIANLHNATITVTSDPNDVTEFLIRFPLEVS